MTHRLSLAVNRIKSNVKMKREFNTSGPCIISQHYTLMRPKLVERGRQLVNKMRYFTIWAPRQTGKSTYFRLLADELKTKGYYVSHINFENYRNASLHSFMDRLTWRLEEDWHIDFKNLELSQIFKKIETITDKKLVLIIDEVEGINTAYFNDFLHAIRNAYHSRETHGLKSVIMVGVSNIVGVIEDNASPFNIADNLNVPYFTNEETIDLLGQHEAETGQLFEDKVKAKISEITANQPGLVNGFAKKLVEDNPTKKVIDYSDYLKVENWYLRKAIDKNVSNIINKAKKYRSFVERLLFDETPIPFEIDRASIKFLHTNGIINADENDNIVFWVPLYKKRLYKAFYPYTNGENKEIQLKLPVHELITSEGLLNIAKFIEHYKIYVKRRSFRYFREKDKDGNFKSIKEAALMYSFETYIQAVLQMLGGTSYREADTGLGKSDLIINVSGKEQLVESKLYYYPKQFIEGRIKLAHYCQSLGLAEAIYLVFLRNDAYKADVLKENTMEIEGTTIHTFIVEYDEQKDF